MLIYRSMCMCESNFKKNLLPGIALFEYCSIIVDTILFSSNKREREWEDDGDDVVRLINQFGEVPGTHPTNNDDDD